MTDRASRITLEITGERTLGAVGVLDSHTADEFEARLASFGTEQDLLVDFSEVSFVDSSGLRALVTVHKLFEPTTNHLTVRGANRAVMRVFELTGLVEHFHLA